MPKAIEKYMTFSIEVNKIIVSDRENPLIFVDSLHFVNG